jgi:hypothetical protein
MTAKRNRRPARGECALAVEDVGHFVPWQFFPALAIVGAEHQELATHGITQCNAMNFRIASQRIQKESPALVGILQFPGFTAVGRFVYPRLVAFTARHHVRRIFAESFNVPKIKIPAAGSN